MTRCILREISRKINSVRYTSNCTRLTHWLTKVQNDYSPPTTHNNCTHTHRHTHTHAAVKMENSVADDWFRHAGFFPVQLKTAHVVEHQGADTKSAEQPIATPWLPMCWPIKAVRRRRVERIWLPHSDAFTHCTPGTPAFYLRV